MRTVNRIPRQVTITDITEEYFNMVSFEGIKNSENDLKVSPLTLTDSNNVYVNSNNVLSSRPSIKATNFQGIDSQMVSGSNIKKVWVVDNILVYHTGTTLRFVKDKVLSSVIVNDVGNTIDVLESIENYIFVYPANKYVNMTSVDGDNINTFASGSISDMAYVPTTELRSGNEITNPEKPNMISPKYKTSVIYDKKVYNDLSEFNGEDIEVLIDSDTYNIEDFDSRLDPLKFQKLLTVADFDYVKYSSIGSAIGYKEYMFYYAADGSNFVALPVAPSGLVGRHNPLDPDNPTIVKNVGEGFITEAGDAIFVIGYDHIYGLSLLETYWDSVTNSVIKRWEDWTKLDWDTATILDTDMSVATASTTSEDIGIRLNLINITNPDNPHPTTYSKNYSRFINDNTFVLTVYAGDVTKALVDGDPTGYIRPTLFVYNHAVSTSKVKIYQIATPDVLQGQNLVNEICASDFELFGNKLIISMAYRYRSNETTGLTKLATMTVDVSIADGVYTFVKGVNNGTLTSITISASPPLCAADIKLSYTSYNVGLSSGTYNQLNYELTIMYNNEGAMSLNKYIITERVYPATPDDNVLLSSSLNLDFGAPVQSPIVLMNRSTNKVLLYNMILLANPENVVLYEATPYLISEYMRPIYIDDDKIITTAITPIFVDESIIRFEESNEIYTTDGVIATVSLVKENEDFVLPQISITAKLSNIYFADDKNLYIGYYMYDEDEKLFLYFPTNLWEEFEETIFQLQILSRDTLGVYCRDSLWIIYRDEEGLFRKIKTKISSSCREGDSVSLSLDGEGSLFPCHRGIAYISHQSLLSTEEQKLSFISDNIQNFMVEWIRNKAVRIFTHEYWMYIYSKDSKEVWVMDLRSSTWWRWSFPTNIDNMVIYLDDVYVLTNNRLCLFTFEGIYNDAIDYNGNWKLTSIPWFIESQRLYLKDINRYKHIYSMIINSRVEDDEIEEKYLRLETMVFRSQVSKSPEEILSYKIAGHKSFVKRLRIFKCNLFKFKLSSDTSTELEPGTVEPTAVKIEGITIKYGVKEKVR